MQRSSRVHPVRALFVLFLLALTGVAQQATFQTRNGIPGPLPSDSKPALKSTADSQQQNQSQLIQAPLDNFDIRADQLLAQPRISEPAITRKTTQSTKAYRLQRDHPTATIRWQTMTGTPAQVLSRNEPLSQPDQADAEIVSRRFLRQHSDLYQLSEDDLAQLRVRQRHTTQHNGMTHLTLQQLLDGRAVFQSELTAHMDRQGAVIATIGTLWPTPSLHRKATEPSLTASAALQYAAQYAGAKINSTVAATQKAVSSDQPHSFRLSEFARAVQARLVYFPLAADELRLAWEFELWRQDAPDAYLIVVDAERGSLLYRYNLTCYEENPLHPRGLIYAADSPRPANPYTTDNPATVARSERPFNGAAIFTLTDPHYDWWAGSNADSLLSNNVFAHLDRDANNMPDPPLLNAPDGNFSFPLDLTQPPYTENNQKAAQVNLFYWSNRFHDQLYSYGFTEAAGNFQRQNFGLGGEAEDAIEADAQDGSGTNNANFSTPPDGRPGRVQMFLWNGSPQPDGDLDRSVIYHELTHGVSNRLIGNGTGLSGFQARSLGEGWSDYLALALTRSEGDPLDGAYAIGQYVRNDYSRGIRRFAYSTRREIYPYTLAQVSLSPSVHAAGEIWCVTLWEMRARLIAQLGFAEGQRQSIQLVIDGMKLTPPDPTFLDARDAILLADRINNGGAHQCLLWEAFASRGSGYTATTTGVADNAPVESFALPPYCSATATLQLDKNNYVTGELLRVTLGDRNAPEPAIVQVHSSVTNDTEFITLTPDPGMPGSFVGSLRTAAGRGVNDDGALQVSVDAGDQIIVTYQDEMNQAGVPALSKAVAGVVRERTVFADDVEAGNQGWITTGAWAITQTQSSPPTHVWSDSPGGSYASNSDTSLVSPVLDLSNLSDVTLTFTHSFALENRYDFGIVEYSIDEGETWAKAAAFTGSQSEFMQASVALEALANHNTARIRFRLVSDQAITGDGWFIDNIRITARSANPAIIKPGSPPAPVITSISPASGLPVGGTRITISGLNFTDTADTTVTFDDVPAESLNVIGFATLTATVPPHQVGAVTVRISNRNGSVALPAGFLYYESADTHTMPMVDQFFPTSGSLRGGAKVTFSGNYFTPETTVRFGSLPAVVSYINARTLLITAPPATTAEPVPVIISNGTQSLTLNQMFSYTAPQPPTIQMLSPDGGEQFYPGNTISIRWKSSDNDTLVRHSIHLMQNNNGQLETVAVLASDLSGTAQAFNWKIPLSVQPTAQARIRVIATDGEGLEAEAYSGSDFSIRHRWEAAASLPFPLQRLATASDGQYLYAISGRTTTTSATTVETVSRFDPATNVWTTLNMAPIPMGLSSSAAVFLRGRIYVPGGFTSASTLPTSHHYAFDVIGNSWSLVAAAPVALSQYALAADETRGVFYLTGGTNSLGGSVAGARTYNAMNDRWSDLPPMLRARSGHAATLIAGRLYVAGGFGVAGGLVEAEVFDFNESKWTQIASLHQPRRNAISAAGQDQSGNPLWLIIGGEDPNTGLLLNSAEAYDPITNQWLELDDSFGLPFARTQAAGAVLNGMLYSIGGAAMQGSFVTLSSVSNVERMKIGGFTPRHSSMPPVLAVPTTRTAIVGEEIVFNVTANDLHSAVPLTITAAGLPDGATFTTTSPTSNSTRGEFRWTPGAESSGQTVMLSFTASDGILSDVRAVMISVVTATPLTVVSAAHYQGGMLVPDAIVAAFGTDLAIRTENASTLPLPFELAGTSVTVNGVAAPLFFVSPQQINFAVPPALDIGHDGMASVIVTTPAGRFALGKITLGSSQPALFTRDATGQGEAAAVATPDGINYQTAPFDIRLNERPNILVLYGTGFRHSETQNAADDNGVAEVITVTIGGEPAEVLYAGAQGQFTGLDQLNVMLPAGLAGNGSALPRQVEVVVKVNQLTANRVLVTIR